MVCLILVNRVKNLVKISFFFFKFFETRNVDRLGGCRERSGVTSFAAASPVAHRPHNQRLITFPQKKFQLFWPKTFMKKYIRIVDLDPFRKKQFCLFLYADHCMNQILTTGHLNMLRDVDFLDTCVLEACHPTFLFFLQMPFVPFLTSAMSVHFTKIYQIHFFAGQVLA